MDAIKKTCKNYLESIDISNIANEINNKKNIDIKIQEQIKELESKEKDYLRKLDMLYEDKIKSLIDIENPTRKLIQTITEKIVIDKDKNFEIIYRFSVLNSI